ncbi:hypothetical protein AGENTSMITH_181 [Bacillus phage vB_BspM_AgentSmith]|nr:hypothetical protein AGENTSMITH_181 [Bacillus phage vB_BspM_AgentSmith]
MSVRINFDLAVEGKTEWSYNKVLPTENSLVIQSYAERVIKDIVDGIRVRVFRLNELGWDSSYTTEYESSLRNLLSGVFRVSCIAQDTIHKQYPCKDSIMLATIITPCVTGVKSLV